MSNHLSIFEMSQKTGSIPSLKMLEKDCSTVNIDSSSQTLLVTSPYPEATLASAILSRALLRSNRKFHVTFVQPVMTVESLIEMRTKFESSTVIAIGIDVLGTKKIKKGKSYPILIGGTSESEQLHTITIGTDFTITPAAYTLAKSQVDVSSYDLQLAATGVLIQDGMNGTKKGANKEITDLAEKEGLVEERKGFRLFGVGMLPLDEALLHSTHPYLPTISGNQKACDELLIASEIPVQKLRSPLNNLNTSEAQRLTSNLITRLDPGVIPYLLGKDYILKLERESSPIRYVSGVEIVATTAWARHELGTIMSVWLGDRGRALRVMIDSHMSHNKDVISSVQRLDSGLIVESTSSATIVKLIGSKAEILPDAGRIALSNRLVDPDKPLVLDNEESSTIIWPSSRFNTKQVLRSLLKKGVLPLTSSSQSVTIINSPEVREMVLQLILNIDKAGS
ncbi:MAG: hypothetical protein ACFFCT_06120 [Candidatus Odinarchaeota archaeon]